jgi:hypothetical protein
MSREFLYHRHTRWDWFQLPELVQLIFSHKMPAPCTTRDKVSDSGEHSGGVKNEGR